MKYIVALDQGTTSSRAVVFDEQARVVAAHGPGGFGSGLEIKRRLLALETGDAAPFGFKW